MKYIASYHLLKFEFVKLEFFEKITFKFAGKFLWNSSTIKNFQNFSMELEHSGKLEFLKLEYPKSGRSLRISETVID